MKVYDITNNFKENTSSFEFGKSNYWIILTPRELNSLQYRLLLEDEILTDCCNNDNSPKISFFDGYLFLITNLISYYKGTVSINELDVILSKDYIITVIKEDMELVSDLLNDISDSKNCFILKNNPKASMVMYYILDRIILNNYNVLASIEADADKIEINILKNLEHKQLGNLINIRRQVFKIKKCLNPLRHIGDSLIENENFIIEKDNIIHFMHLNNKIHKLLMTLESLLQDLALVREAFESEIANKTNELMKVFTIIATVFLPLDLITGLLSMNVKHVPFVDLEYGYYYILATMFTLVMLLCYVFKIKKWL